MGSAMSGHLLAAGFRVAGYDIDPDRLAEHAGRGGDVAASPAQAAASAAAASAAAASAASGADAGTTVVVTSLPSAAALGEVAGGLAGGLVVIETSTLPIDVKERARDALAARGGTLLDCPLSGTGAQARRNDLVAYLSGDDAAKQHAAPVLRAMTRGYFDVGEFGNGMRMKIVANHLVTVHNLAAAEALILAERSGLDLAMVLDAISAGAGASRMFQIRGPAMAAGDYTGPGIRAEVFAKDIDIIDALANALRVPTPLFAAASVYYRAALAQGRGGQDTACVHAVLKQLMSAQDEMC
jgi:putative dehydrogenase